MLAIFLLLAMPLRAQLSYDGIAFPENSYSENPISIDSENTFSPSPGIFSPTDDFLSNDFSGLFRNNPPTDVIIDPDETTTLEETPAPIGDGWEIGLLMVILGIGYCFFTFYRNKLCVFFRSRKG
jgi:hypothetical protein